ncbi:hypothetical protein ELQ90_12040 [Labedella phragmitis]|uniref:DUF7882 domain-containing protein n=1 Tax=Labedella phragmitis TaxID=2498849 RepID=A0A444PS46_9MICO|nr:hypothetical protein [Labedella phragmitis]RWZ50066.1 hypothetical protein ELQ90_12040 [Labedella phragmitis]
MATFTYGTTATTLEIDDRQLAHLQHIIAQRFRRQESLLLTFVLERGGERRRRTVWLSPSSPLEFDYDASVSQSLNRSWLEDLMQQSYSVGGVVLAQEPGTDASFATARATDENLAPVTALA